MLYNKFFKSSFEELLSYYPRFYYDVFEMVEILKANGRLADNIEAATETTLANCFINTADEATISQWEQFLEIFLIRRRSLEERRELIKSFMIGVGNISASVLCSIISAYTGSTVKCRFEPADSEGNNRLFITFDKGKHGEIYLADIAALILKKIPAHIWYSIIMDLVPDKPLNLTAGIKTCGISKRIHSQVEKADSSIFAIKTAFQAGFAVGGIYKKIRAEVRENGMEQRGAYRQRT